MGVLEALDAPTIRVGVEREGPARPADAQALPVGEDVVEADMLFSSLP